MYWFGPDFQNWTDAHNSAGVTTTGTNWALAEGQEGGGQKYKTFVLIANPSTSDASVRLPHAARRRTAGHHLRAVHRARQLALHLLRGATGGMRRPRSRQLQDGELFGIQLESINGTPIVIERALYWDFGGEAYSAGTNETGIRIK